MLARDLRDRRPQAADVDVAGEQLERVVDARAGLEQQREVAREDGDVLGARRCVSESKAAARLRSRPRSFGRRCRSGRGRDIRCGARPRPRSARDDRAADDLAVLASARGSREVRHRRFTVTVVTRSTSAAEVTPARHLATASSIIVVMPASTAACIDRCRNRCRLAISLRTGSVISSTSNTPTRPR